MQTPLGKQHPPAADDGENLTDDPDLWRTLGRARRPPAPSPYFARRVLREVILLEEQTPGWRRWLGRLGTPGWFTTHRRPALGVAAALVLSAAAFARLPRNSSFPSPTTPASAVEGGEPATPESFAAPFTLTLESVSEGDVGVINDLDDLLETDENRLWLEDDATS